jgi:hypothetical protein
MTNLEPWKIRATFAFFVMLGFFGVLAAYMLLPVPDNKAVESVLLTLTGVLAGEFKSVLGFYFSTSAGSRAKDAALLAAVPPVTNGTTNKS